MHLPRFQHSTINHKITSTDEIGKIFQSFVQELFLKDYPHLNNFTGGKDGGIDLVQFDEESCYVIECKFIGDYDFTEVKKRWKKVENHLEENLKNPDGPTNGQSQYAPWYDKRRKISEYVFCTNVEFSNFQQKQSLLKIINDFFHKISSQSHLSHLKNIKISVLDWGDLVLKINAQPHLIFRWFPSSRPKGLIPIDAIENTGNFREFLTSAKLPYYSISEHIRSFPISENVSIQDEDSLLANFENPKVTGLIISGKGGIGKSRLTLELGWIAHKKGWIVMRVPNKLTESALEDLAERFSTEIPVLLLVDYIETQNDFLELVETMQRLNSGDIAKIHYIAACRTDYYYKAVEHTDRHLHINLTPVRGEADREWLKKYRLKTVEKILEKTNLSSDQNFVTICKDLPILAVFLAYLFQSNRNEDLKALLKEGEFGKWVLKRVHRAFQGEGISSELAKLIALFPLNNTSLKILFSENYKQIFDQLANDGWIEEIQSEIPELDSVWSTAHDVLSDQILISYLQKIQNTVEHFIIELFCLAGRTDCLSSAIFALQRIADVAPLNAVNWLDIISKSIIENPDIWKQNRDLLLVTSLLKIDEIISLFNTYSEIWQDAEKDTKFQNRLGWLARQVNEDTEKYSSETIQLLVEQISKAIPYANTSNFIITSGLRLSAQDFKEPALQWIKKYPTQFQTHYLIVAWLECNLPIDEIKDAFVKWCSEFPTRFQISFLIDAWLSVGGEKNFVLNIMQVWLLENKKMLKASFVYTAWLRSGGDPSVLTDSIKDWFKEYQNNFISFFLLEDWLKANGEKNFIEVYLMNWLTQFGTNMRAGQLYCTWLNAKGDELKIKDFTKSWLIKNGLKPNASYFYSSWIQAKGDFLLIQDFIKEWAVKNSKDATAPYVFSAWLHTNGDREIIRSPAINWLSSFKEEQIAIILFDAWLRFFREPNIIQNLIRDWLKNYSEEPSAYRIYWLWLQSGGEIQFIQKYIEQWLNKNFEDINAGRVISEWLKAGGNREFIKEYMRKWLDKNSHEIIATRVFFAWLKAKGGKLFIRNFVKNWLIKNELEKDAKSIYIEWLKTRDDFSIVENSIKNWLSKFINEEEMARAVSVLERSLLRFKQAKNLNLAQGDIKIGIVDSIQPYGIFVSCNDCEGLVHISEIAWFHVKNPNDHFKVGDKIRVKILKIENEKISFSLKQLIDDPWLSLHKNYPLGAKKYLPIDEIYKKNVTFRLENGIVSAVPKSKLNMSEKKLRKGHIFLVKVVSINIKARKVELSIVDTNNEVSS